MKYGITPREASVLKALYRYRYLDSAHLKLIANWTNKNFDRSVLNLKRAGIIEQLSNNHFGRDSLTAHFIYQLGQLGTDYVEGQGTEFKATWLDTPNHGQPLHNLNLCLSLASIELACRAAGLEFRPWGKVLAEAPLATRDLEHPWHFDANSRKTPDAVFQIKYPDGWATFIYELDITNHGAKEYKEKYDWYTNHLVAGHLKAHLGINHQPYILTATISGERMGNLISYLPERNKHFLFKATPQYGPLLRPPAPNLSILDGWITPKHVEVNLGHQTTERAV